MSLDQDAPSALDRPQVRVARIRPDPARTANCAHMKQNQHPVPGDSGLLDLLPEVAPRVEEFPEECLDRGLAAQFSATGKLSALTPHGVLVERREGTLDVPLVQRAIGGDDRIGELVHGISIAGIRWPTPAILVDR